MTDEHIAARKTWREGEIVVQIGWSHHGQVQIVLRADGVDMAVWWTETASYVFDF